MARSVSYELQSPCSCHPLATAELTMDGQSSQQDRWRIAARERYLPPPEATNF